MILFSTLFEGWIQTQALAAILENFLRPAAISTIPVASTCIIRIIAIAVSGPFRRVASSGTRFLYVSLVLRVLARAIAFWKNVLRSTKMVSGPTSLAF